MRNLDLGPNDYRVRDPKTGRWNFRDDPKLARNYLFVLIAVLIFIFVTRNDGTRESLFGITAMFSFVAGGMFSIWLKDRY